MINLQVLSGQKSSIQLFNVKLSVNGKKKFELGIWHGI